MRRLTSRIHRCCYTSATTAVALSPDYEIEKVSLNEQVHEVLDRRSPFPDYLDPEEIYAFDPVADSVLQPYRRRAKLQASFLGEAAGGSDVTRYVWIVADRSSDVFGQEVDYKLMDDPGTGTFLQNRGVVMIGGSELFVEKVEVTELDVWRRRQRADARRPPRQRGTASLGPL